MSYCHLLAGGYSNIDIRFHHRCITERCCRGSTPSGTCRASGGFPPASRFYTVAPCRRWTRGVRAGPYGGPALAANSGRTFVVGGQCGVPSTAKAVSVNVSVTQASSAGNLRLYAGGTGLPNATAIDHRANQTRANNGSAPLGTAGSLAVR